MHFFLGALRVISFKHQQTTKGHSRLPRMQKNENCLWIRTVRHTDSIPNRFFNDEQHAKIPSTERGNIFENFDFKTK